MTVAWQAPKSLLKIVQQYDVRIFQRITSLQIDAAKLDSTDIEHLRHFRYLASIELKPGEGVPMTGLLCQLAAKVPKVAIRQTPNLTASMATTPASTGSGVEVDDVGQSMYCASVPRPK